MASDRTASWAGEETQLLPPGHRVGDWIVTEPIGSGGWATVYAARAADGPGEGSTGGAAEGPAEAALKVLPTAGLGPHQARKVAEAARREVALARTAPHPRLVRLLDTLVLAAPGLPALDGAIVLVMERARCSLRELLHTGIDAARGARIVTGICEGLAHLHGSGWVHTDLKPENVLVGDDGEVRLSDFGFAIELTGTHGYAAPMGTLDYLPPERWKEPLGEHGVRIRPTADIWALGIVIHEVFAAGASPFPGATPTQRGAAVQEYAEGRAALRMDHALPEFWRALAADCLAPGHTARAPHTADSLLARIRTEQPAAPPRRRRGTRAALLTLVGCLLAGGGGALWWYAADASGTHGPGRGAPAAGPAGIRVFNAERGCQGRTDREPQCSLGLAVDPRRAYTAENVVPTRVWHGDVLDAECRLARGKPIIDEEDLTSTVWYRVRLPGPDRAATAWLPAVRTKDRPDLPPCP
ncbi:serine/threonine-protein kinase [Streptomyces sp. NPDC090025]|uniref:serine/threonine-protein kinase n=1 Tax=Streptomyces sp. NPDC090025 TaxID=3365922 RepID=UPI003835AE37